MFHQIIIGQHLSTSEIAAELYISDRLSLAYSKERLQLNAFHRVPAQVLNIISGFGI